MDEAQTITELRAVLARVSGVSLDRTESWEGHIGLVLRIERIESIGPILYAAAGANVGVDLWTGAKGQPVHERSNPALVRYRVRAKGSADSPEGALESMQFFGAYVIWYLHGTGGIETSEANRLLGAWNCIQVSP